MEMYVLYGLDVLEMHSGHRGAIDNNVTIYQHNALGHAVMIQHPTHPAAINLPTHC